jgi:putative DNA primase/helicase
MKRQKRTKGIRKSKQKKKQKKHSPKRRTFNLTDGGNAKLFAHTFQGEARYNHREHGWIVWSEGRWKKDEEGRIWQMAKDVARIRYLEASRIKDDFIRRRAIGVALRIESLWRLKAMIELAKSEPPLADDGLSWDNDPYLLGVANGVVDLRTFELRKDKREDHVTLHTTVPFDITAKCPRWEQFLREIFNRDQEVIGYIHRLIGYTLTGLNREQYFHVLFGEGQNGKSLFLNIIKHIFGPYSFTLPFSAFEKTGSTNSHDLAATAGKRLISALEVDERATLNEARIKSMTGGDELAGRFLYRNTFNFKPTAKLFLVWNRRPAIQDESHALWRRIRLIPFTQRFEGRNEDKVLEETLKAESPGILTWAIDGFHYWLDEGLGECPRAITLATKSYRDASDYIGQFLDECCEFAPTATVPTTELRAAYCQWCLDNDYPESHPRQFNERLATRGLKREKRSILRIMTWLGLRLKKRGGDT